MFSGSSGHRNPWASVSPATANTSNKHHALFAYDMESTSYDVSGILARERSTSVSYVTERSGGGTKRSAGSSNAGPLVVPRQFGEMASYETVMRAAEW